jgi:predicted permease
MRESLNRLLDWFRRDRLEREMAEELQFHRQLAERDARASGMTPADAAYEAKRRFGNATTVAEESRDRWSLPRLEQIHQDVRYALRGLRRSPGFTSTALITLALGIGANVAMFSVVDQLMFKPFPYLRDPATVHRLYLKYTYRGQESVGGGEYARYLDMRRFTTSFSQFAGFATQTMAVGFGPAARDRRIGTVSGSFWEFFDARPAVGRYFTAAEDEPPRGAEVSVLSYAFWQSEYGGRADVIGQRLQVGHIPTTIIGVAPRGFSGIFDPEPAIYIPMTLYAGSTLAQQDREQYSTRYNWGWMSTMARRKPGVSEAAANADVTQAYRRSYTIEQAIEGNVLDLARDNPRGVIGPIKLAAGPTAGAESKTALWVTGVALIVLLIACANVANLSLARAFRRQREIAVRLALGVSRTRLTSQMLIESVMLAVFGGVAGVLVAHWGSVAIQRMLVTSTESMRPTLTDWRMMALVGALVTGAGLLAGIAPAVLAGRGDLAPTLRGGSRGGVAHRSRLRGALLVLQGALSVVLLIGASLFVLSLQHVKRFRLGYDAAGVLSIGTTLRGYQIDSVGRIAMRRDLLARAQATPGVQYAAIATSIPLTSSSSMSLFVPGIDSVSQLGRFTYQVTTPDYFKTMGTRIIRGRPFTDADRAGSPAVIVVSESMAKTLWPNQEALGKCVHVRYENSPCRTVIGIAEDIVQSAAQMTEGKRLSYYVPLYQLEPQGNTYMLIKMRGDAESQMEAVRKSLLTVMPGPSYPTVRTMETIVGGTQRSWRLGANLFVVFGLLALVVAAIGLYGVIAYNVTQRMHELGVRVALGAQTRDILGLIVGQGARFALAGVIVGSLLAFVASRWVEPLLFEQSARDPRVFAAVGSLMLLVALAACASPARRAASADPNAALRSE